LWLCPAWWLGAPQFEYRLLLDARRRGFKVEAAGIFRFVD
jgi:hypothetical protein